MKEISTEFERLCQEHLRRYFAKYPDATMETRAAKTVRFIHAHDKALAGKPEGWAAGIVYYLANRDQKACGVPGVLNGELESFFGITMGTVRKRAARVEVLLAI